MAVTNHQAPESYTPGYSPQIFTASSNQVAQPNFTYTVKCTDLLSGDIQYVDVLPDPDDLCKIDVKFFSETFLTHFIPINEYGWQQADGVRKIRVNIGETYGSTPSYASGSNQDFIVWNAVLDWKEYPVYDPNLYVYDGLDNHIPYLNRSTEEDTFNDRSNYLYALTKSAGDILEIQIAAYDSAGNVIANSAIPNPYQASSVYSDKYLCIDIGKKGLDSIASGLVTGDYPILPANCAYYTITDSVVTGAPPVGTLTLLKTIYIKCEPKFDVFTVHYLDKSGCFQTLNFSKLSNSVLTKQQSTYSKLPFEVSGTDYVYSPSSRVKRVLSSERTNRVTLSTDWLTEDQVEYYQGLLDSPVIYFDFGSDQDYLQVMLVTDSYRLNKRYNELLYTMQMDFEYAHSNTRQVG